jgi:YD repeat-containing protein
MILILSFWTHGFASQDILYDFQTTFRSDPAKPQHFDTQEALEAYLHSFGYLSKQLHLISVESFPNPENPEEGYDHLTYATSPNDDYFMGEKIGQPRYYADDPRDENAYRDTAFSSSYAVVVSKLYRKIKYYNPDEFRTENELKWKADIYMNFFPPEKWNFERSVPLDKYESNQLVYSQLFKQTVEVAYSYTKHLEPYGIPRKYVSSSYLQTLYQAVEVVCIPPGGHDSHTEGRYQPVGDKSLGGTPLCTCAPDYSGNCLTVEVKKWYGICQDEQQSCKTAGDPVDLFSGTLRETLTDFTVHSLYPIVIQRYYSSQSTLWTLSYSRHIELHPRPQKSTLLSVVRDDGSTYVFELTDQGAIPPPGFQGIFNPATYEYLAPNGETETYDPQGRLIQIRTRQGSGLSFSYEQNKQVIDDHRGHQVTLSWDPTTRTKVITLPNEAVITYRFDSSHQLTQVDYPNFGTMRYVYKRIQDQSHLIQAIDATGQIISKWDYDDEGRAISNYMHR